MKPVMLAAAVAVMLLGQPLWSSPAPSAAGRPARLEGMEYLKARKIILGYGWKPFRGECNGPDVDSGTCQRYPEIDDCTGVGIGLCAMTFARGNLCLHVVTVGGAPHDEPGDTAVRHLTFRRGRCTPAPAQ